MDLKYHDGDIIIQHENEKFLFDVGSLVIGDVLEMTDSIKNLRNHTLVFTDAKYEVVLSYKPETNHTIFTKVIKDTNSHVSIAIPSQLTFSFLEGYIRRNVSIVNIACVYDLVNITFYVSLSNKSIHTFVFSKAKMEELMTAFKKIMGNVFVDVTVKSVDSHDTEFVSLSGTSMKRSLRLTREVIEGVSKSTIVVDVPPEKTKALLTKIIEGGFRYSGAAAEALSLSSLKNEEESSKMGKPYS